MERYDETATGHAGKVGGTFYAEDLVTAREQRRVALDSEHIIRVEDQIWEDSPHGLLKHIAHPAINPLDYDIDAYIQEIGPDGASGKHQHMAEEFVFVLSGHGYSLHWDVELAEMRDDFQWRMADVPQRFEWEAGDWMFIPCNTAHQHFNADGDEPARLLCATSRIYKFLGWHDLRQLEDAPRPRTH